MKFYMKPSREENLPPSPLPNSLPWFLWCAPSVVIFYQLPYIKYLSSVYNNIYIHKNILICENKSTFYIFGFTLFGGEIFVIIFIRYLY